MKSILVYRSFGFVPIGSKNIMTKTKSQNFTEYYHEKSSFSSQVVLLNFTIVLKCLSPFSNYLPFAWDIWQKVLQWEGKVQGYDSSQELPSVRIVGYIACRLF